MGWLRQYSGMGSRMQYRGRGFEDLKRMIYYCAIRMIIVMLYIVCMSDVRQALGILNICCRLQMLLRNC